MLGSVGAAEWLYGTISGLPAVQALGTNRVWERKAPPDCGVPYVIFRRTGAADIAPIGGAVVAQQLSYQWFVVNEGSDTTTIQAAAEAIDAATDGARAALASGWRIEAVRQSELPLDEPTDEGREMCWLGGVLSLFVTR